MSHLKFMQTFFYSLLVLVGIGFASCKDQTKPVDTEEVAQEANEPKSDLTKESDERFLVRAAEINLGEIELGKLAQQRGTHAEVKALGKMMEDAHTKAMNDLRALASSKAIAIPTSPTQDDMDLYKKMTEQKVGMDFDKEYCDKMVNGHKDAIDLFDNATKGNNDPDVKTFAMNMLPELRTHLDHAQLCQDKLKNMK